MTASVSPNYGQASHHEMTHRDGLQPINQALYRPPLHLVGPEGQLQVHTAPYRGSFSGVLSEAIRTAGLGSRVMIVQFLKGGVSQGPQGAINLCGRLEWMRPSIRMCITQKADHHSEQEEKSKVIKSVIEIWKVCKERILAENLDQLVLDEVGLAISLGYINENDLINTLERRPPAMDIIITGPSIPSGIIAMADQITELRSSH